MEMLMSYATIKQRQAWELYEEYVQEAQAAVVIIASAFAFGWAVMEVSIRMWGAL
jgi:hypothetical protein